jgi:LacI family transcriptional regulator
VSRRALERRFQRALGRGLAQEICRVRLERCKRLLTETELALSVVARHSGFTSARHLASVFRRELGLTPTGYRKRTRLPREP